MMFTFSPINQRRWHNFKSNRRGYVSFWMFLALFILCLFAELIANDKPLLIKTDQAIYLPFLIAYPETDFGGEFATEADYRDPFVQSLVKAANGTIFWPPIRYSYKTHDLDLPTPAPSPPTWSLKDEQCKAAAQKYGGIACKDLDKHWLGTDDQGRDVLARLIYGFRISVLFGLILASISSVIGVFFGAIQGYFGGWIDLLFQRFVEIWNSIPSLYLLIILTAVFEPSFWMLLGILLLFSWVSLVGVVRAEFFRARNFEYVKAAKALGLSDAVIMTKHVLPNAMVATLTFIPFILNGAITTLTSLDFLGFGLPPGSPSLGELLAQGKSNLQAPWLGLTGFFSIALMLSLLVFAGEAIRDAFDPRKIFS